MKTQQIIKYPRTRHIEGSNEQIGDDLEKIPFESLRGKHVVVEEKMDGSQSAISFSSDGEMLLQSRGHYLTGGYGERHFALLKQMANTHRRHLWDLLGSRFVMYGEWLYAKHTIFYDKLPSYFMEFDIYDKELDRFFDTHTRDGLFELIDGQYALDLAIAFPSVRVLFEGELDSYEQLVSLVGDSAFINHDVVCSNFEDMVIQSRGAKLEKELENTDLTGVMEGLYIKVEEDGEVQERYKFVRSSFTQKVIDSAGHWQTRPIVRNIVDV